MWRDVWEIEWGQKEEEHLMYSIFLKKTILADNITSIKYKAALRESTLKVHFVIMSS